MLLLIVLIYRLGMMRVGLSRMLFIVRSSIMVGGLLSILVGT